MIERIRKYFSYQRYLNHQGKKFSKVEQQLRSNYAERKAYHLKEFALVKDLAGSILCLGARDGAEVDALREMGVLAIGIDVEYPTKSHLVHYGDFQVIPYPDSVFDWVYSNALDHALEPERFLQQAARVLKPNGKLLLRIGIGTEEGLPAGKYETCAWKTRDGAVNWIIERGFSLATSHEVDHRYRLYEFRSNR